VKLSIIVPTRNRATVLADALESFSRQSLAADQFEVVVVDNGSTDETSLVIERFVSTNNNFSSIYVATPGLHVCRHAGMRAAKSENLLYCDDDIIASPRWAESVAHALSDPAVGVVVGRTLPKFEESPPLWLETMWGANEFGRYLGHYSLLDFGGQDKEVSPLFIWGCNFAIRRSILLRCGGFHPDAMPREQVRFRGDGESGLARALLEQQIRAVYAADALVQHLVPKKRLTADYLYHRGFLQGVSESYSELRHPAPSAMPKKGVGRAVMDLVTLHALRQNVSKLLQAAELNHYQASYRHGYRDGFDFHQREVRRDPSLLEWVQLADYLDDQL
jgi:glycosyltransferase involved in cell wall biosynthesis